MIVSEEVGEDGNRGGKTNKEKEKKEKKVTKTEKTREIRLILTERINGRCMRDSNPADFPQQQRQRLMALVETETAVYNHDIRHYDIHPRNVIVTQDSGLGSEQESRVSQSWLVVLVDFGRAWMSRSPFPE